jgi:hypothetical protein
MREMSAKSGCKPEKTREWRGHRKPMGQTLPRIQVREKPAMLKRSDIESTAREYNIRRSEIAGFLFQEYN